jgi:hypothetical protein
LPTSSDRRNPETGKYGRPSPEKGEEDSDESDSPIVDLPKIDLNTPEKCQEMMQYVTTLQAKGRIKPKQAEVIFQAINNALELCKLQTSKQEDA